MLSDMEASGFWGPGIFLNIRPGQENHSLTIHAVYWAGGIDPQDWVYPLVIRTASFSDLRSSAWSKSCLYSGCVPTRTGS